jgi:hypothetical protein
MLWGDKYKSPSYPVWLLEMACGAIPAQSAWTAPAPWVLCNGHSGYGDERLQGVGL